jgi:3-oxoacyl-[acyl-carrier-protein] synthase II
MRSRVFITGSAGMTPLGATTEEILEGIGSERKGMGHLTNVDAREFPCSYAAEARQGDSVISTAHSVDRKAYFLESSLQNLFDTCGWLGRYEPGKRHISIGAGLDYLDFIGLCGEGPGRCEMAEHHASRSFDVVENLSETYGIKGGVHINVTACVASSQSVGLAFRMLREHPDRMLITGGFDSMLNHLHYMGFYKLGALSAWEGDVSGACRPFDSSRTGVVLGEGAAVFALESGENAREETIMAEITGYASTMDAYLPTDPDPSGSMLAAAAREAIKDAGISADEIDCVHVHGTGTYKNDLAEAAALKIVFGDRYTDIPVYSMKGQVGHLIGACGAMEIFGVLYSIRNQMVPVTVNCEKRDPDIPLNVITDGPVSCRINNVLKLNSAFGGQNTAIVFRKYAS